MPINLTWETVHIISVLLVHLHTMLSFLLIMLKDDLHFQVLMEVKNSMQGILCTRSDQGDPLHFGWPGLPGRGPAARLAQGQWHLGGNSKGCEREGSLRFPFSAFWDLNKWQFSEIPTSCGSCHAL